MPARAGDLRDGGGSISNKIAFAALSADDSDIAHRGEATAASCVSREIFAAALMTATLPILTSTTDFANVIAEIKVLQRTAVLRQLLTLLILLLLLTHAATVLDIAPKLPKDNVTIK